MCEDSAFCYACRHFSLPGHVESTFTAGLGFRNWKKATYTDGGFAAHSRSEHHKDAMLAWKEFQLAEKNQGSVMEQLNQNYNKIVEENRGYIKTLAEVVLHCATQNIALRGHRESMDLSRKGNFLGTLDIIARHDEKVGKKMNGPRNAKYTSPDIQNEILSCLAEMVRISIIKEVKESGAFSILVDETKDKKKMEQMSFVLRYYYNGEIHESFLEFEVAEALDAESLSLKIIRLLQRYGLDYKNNLVGQAYDGAAVMSGKKSGVQARIKEVANVAFYVHCSAHCLNLVLVDTVKGLPEADCFFSLLQQLYTYMSGSAVHSKWLNVQKEMYSGDAPRELQALSDTRWASRYNACRNLWDRLPAVVKVLEDLAEENSGERSIGARGLLPQINLQFIVFLAIFKKLLGDAKMLSNLLQSSSLDLAKAVDLVETLIDTFQSYKTEQVFGDLWDTVLELAKQCDISIDAAPKRKRKLSAQLQGYHVLSTVGSHDMGNDKDYYRTAIFNLVLDRMLSELRSRFSRQNCEIMRGIQALNPNSTSFCDKNTLFAFAKMYGCHLVDLEHELHQVKRLLDRKVKQGMQTPHTIVDLTAFIEPYQEVFDVFARLCKIALALPVSTAACERSFSCLKLVKTHLRTTMGEGRLSDLGVLSIEHRRAASLNLDEFVDRFAANHKNRRIQLL